MKILIDIFLCLVVHVYSFPLTFVSPAVLLSVKSPKSFYNSLFASRYKSRLEKSQFQWKGVQVGDVDKDDYLNIDFTYAELGKSVSQSNYSFSRNSIVNGTVTEYDIGGCLVDIGAKTTAFLPMKESSLIYDRFSTIESIVPLNKKMKFQVISNEDEDGQLKVSLRRIQYREAWKRLLDRKMKNEVFEANCVAVNRGGAMFLVEGLRAFLPGSHVQGYTIDDELVGETLPLKFLEVNQRENRLVVSHRRAVIEKEMDSVKRGDIIEGTVKVLKSYGAFIQVGRISGLLHISQISSGLISNLEDVIQPGQTVKCMIIEVDKMNSRIALSTKALEPEPGMMLKDPEKVFNNAEEMGTLYLERMKTKNKQRDIIQTNKSQVEKNELKVNYSQKEEELMFGENILLNNSDILENVISGYNDNFIQNKTSDPSFKEKLQRDT